jgi:hypothetical protein
VIAFGEGKNLSELFASGFDREEAFRLLPPALISELCLASSWDLVIVLAKTVVELLDGSMVDSVEWLVVRLDEPLREENADLDGCPGLGGEVVAVLGWTPLVSGDDSCCDIVDFLADVGLLLIYDEEEFELREGRDL